MKRSIILLALFLGGILLPEVATAADMAPLRHSSVITGPRIRELPFPRSERAQSVWASGACWSECGAYCAWGEAGCLERDAQGICVKLTDKCDRYCQRTCRSYGGPLLAVEMPWD